MRRSLLALTTAALLAVPGALSAQGFGIAGRAGTLGLGAEAALGLSSNFAVRGGVGLLPLEPSATIDDIDFTLKLPESWFNIGADLYLGDSGFRIGGGMLFKPDDPTLEGTFSGNVEVEIGNKTYNASGTALLTGTLDSKNQAPYVLIGFGRHTRTGIGLFLDLGAAFIGEPDISLDASGTFVDAATGASINAATNAEFQAELRRQETNTEDDLGSYLKIWPILNLGLKIGLGG